MENENLIYSNSQIQEILNLINVLPFHGFDSANKLARVFQILNSPIPNEQVNNQVP